MGDRITIRFTDGQTNTPQFYGHWCGLRAIKVANDLVRKGENNGISSLLCNFIVEIMGGKTQEYSYYLYNNGEADGAADYDNWDWTLDVKSKMWTTTDPDFAGKSLTLDEADEYAKSKRPCLYRACKCEDYGSKCCSLKFYESQKQ